MHIYIYTHICVCKYTYTQYLCRRLLNGICGNMNGDQSDDYVTRSGVNVMNYGLTRSSSICNSWQVETSDSDRLI